MTKTTFAEIFTDTVKDFTSLHDNLVVLEEKHLDRTRHGLKSRKPSQAILYGTGNAEDGIAAGVIFDDGSAAYVHYDRAAGHRPAIGTGNKPQVLLATNNFAISLGWQVTRNEFVTP